VGRLSGLAETHIRAIETRTGIRAQAETLERIAAALGCDPAWLLFGKGEPPTVETVLAAVEEGRARLTNAEVAS
jgi:transcriptional regulator with XRE-family HTH domain